ncbi:MAG: exodeoxyribonuclease III [Nitrosospira sp.]|nr:exodeoxyribonuclease III [Nitrosospira sp.]MDW7643335.1 exodeoxyribonuclease III [Nitrosomonadaceae bacterium]MBI0418106.1 exodeoxyribonuclease III [Nitrosospira sp.]MBI0419230.1 exodeoxyribonuclease III [Nitrosospira sp.]MDW7653494.1 exodeoxyribonuclease III [Nitrosomonadaceae bacterium]
MRLATWNVNSLKVRLPQVLNWLAVNQPDVLCLQETKLQDENFPTTEIMNAGYQSIYAGQKTYNGVALLGKKVGNEVITAIPGLIDPQKRVLAATYGDARVVCIYVPNGESVGSEKYQYKLDWLVALNKWLRDELIKYPKLALLGDFNIAPEERDVHDPELWEGKVLFSYLEREAFKELLKLGLVDSFRLFNQPDKSYTWWDYRMMAFRRNMGMRIDHILLSKEFASTCTTCTIDKEPRKNERPSDHSPVIVDLKT